MNTHFLQHVLLNLHSLYVLKADGYDPRKSKVSADTMEKWRVEAVSADLQDVPGIGPAAIKKLAEGEKGDQVTNTYQLFGKVRQDSNQHTRSPKMTIRHLPDIQLNGAYSHNLVFGSAHSSLC